MLQNSCKSFVLGTGKGGMLEHFKSYGYLESFRKTTTTAMWENNSPFVSHRVHFSSAICLGVMRLLFILSHKY
jgi:hypothetical protein